MKTRTAQNIAPRDLTMTVRTSHGNLEDHAGLVLDLRAVLHGDTTVRGRTHETQFNATTDVILVRLPELSRQNPALVATEHRPRLLHLRQLEDGGVEDVERGNERGLLRSMSGLPGGDVPQPSRDSSVFAETENVIIPKIHWPCGYPKQQIGRNK